MPDVQQDIVSTLVAKADGMFRWAVCQLDSLSGCRNKVALQKALSSLPKALDETYSQILDNINEEDIEEALRMLEWVVYSTEPLRLEGLAEVLTIDMEANPPHFDSDRHLPNPRDILDICSTLITTVISDLHEGFEYVRLAHFSVQEYLVSERFPHKRMCTRWSMQAVPANISMAEACLAYLLQFEPGTSLVGEGKTSPLIHQVILRWREYARIAELNGPTKLHRLIMEFFSSAAYTMWKKSQLYEYLPPFHYAAYFRLTETAKLLLKMGVDVHARSEDMGNALSFASEYGLENIEITRLLIDYGIDVNVAGPSGRTPLHAACRRGELGTVLLLIANGVGINAPVRRFVDRNALLIACFWGHLDIVQALLENGANINAQGGCHGNALIVASLRGYFGIVRLLIEKEVDINT
ncbi:hypothetical protein AJ80_01238 [Polytolypa hystricis UAMH7299]|uniref:GPI inositol-deacylase winged helix domain-containing protein n=1 Tax=Polytolypa hystricis (strain UAMH7299) TaxID=1447883 RepID=A0A2B7Z1U8_POLH7|nr:hypothetical protein AJ80_01238 [Polytolypa hystricis UAMH7299]